MKAAEELDNESKLNDILVAWVKGTLAVQNEFCKNWVNSSIKYCTETYRKFTGDDTATVGELRDNDWKEPVPWRDESGGAEEGKRVVSQEAVQAILDALEAVDEFEHGDEYATDVSDMVKYGNGNEDDDFEKRSALRKEQGTRVLEQTVSVELKLTYSIQPVEGQYSPEEGIKGIF